MRIQDSIAAAISKTRSVKSRVACAAVVGFCVAVSIAFACPNPRTYMIQCPTDDEEVDPYYGTGTLWAIADTDDLWLRGYDENAAPIYCRYKFKLFNVTDSTMIECSNYSIPSPRHVACDGIDQWSWQNPSFQWEYGKTYRLELWEDADPWDPCSTEHGPLDCVTFHTISDSCPPAMP